MIEKLQFDKLNGLVPAVIQHFEDGTVLMVGFMNREAVEQTLKDRQVIFWSRTKQRLWKKGETSGNILHVVSVVPDCDNDSLLIKAKPSGPVFHTGERSCFPETSSQTGEFLQRLETVIQSRKKEMPDGSYTTELFRKGVARIAQKVGEEAVELSIAAQYNDKQRIVEETADLLYHTIVLLTEKGIMMQDVYRELEKRVK